MTHDLCSHAEFLLQPTRLIPATAILADSRVIPAEPGIYAWWFKDGLPHVPTGGTITHGDYRLLYVGIAPRAPSKSGKVSSSHLRKRIRSNHLGNRIGSSTLRRSLAALLGGKLDLHVRRNEGGRTVLTKAEERRLTDWIAENGAIGFVTYPKPWLLERQLFAHGPTLPLNIAGTLATFRAEMLRFRAKKLLDTPFVE